MRISNQSASSELLDLGKPTILRGEKYLYAVAGNSTRKILHPKHVALLQGGY